MLDPVLCTREPSLWTKVTWALFQVLTNPLLVLPLLLTFLALPWLFRRGGWRPWVSGLGGLLLVVYLGAGFPPLVGWLESQLTAPLAADDGAPVDAVVVLGRGARLQKSRAAVAATLWRAHRAPLVFASGRGDEPGTLVLLRRQGLPPAALGGENCSRTTDENASFTAQLLQPRGVHRILLVTDPPHLLRSQLTFEHNGFTVIPHASPLNSEVSPWMAGLIVYREFLGYHLYALLGHYRP
jgi:uncharacterized SAM-binding protein YcdF (DUF218 family)